MSAEFCGWCSKRKETAMETVLFVAACCTILSLALNLWGRIQRRMKRRKKMGVIGKKVCPF